MVKGMQWSKQAREGLTAIPMAKYVVVIWTSNSEMLCAWDLGGHLRDYPHTARVGTCSLWIMHSAAQKELCYRSDTIRTGTSPHSCSLRSAPMLVLSPTAAVDWREFFPEIHHCWGRNKTRHKGTKFLGQKQEKCILRYPSLLSAWTFKQQILHEGMLQKTHARGRCMREGFLGGARDLYPPGPVHQCGMGAVSNCCIQKTDRANWFQTLPIILHNHTVHQMQDIIISHRLSINVPAMNNNVHAVH